MFSLVPRAEGETPRAQGCFKQAKVSPSQSKTSRYILPPCLYLGVCICKIFSL